MNDLELKTQDINYTIASPEDLTRLTLILRKIDETITNIELRLKPEIAKAHATHKGLTTLLKETVAPFEQARTNINANIKFWYHAKEQEAIALQNRINEQLAKQAEEIKKKLLEEAKDNEWDKEVAQEKVSSMVPITVDLKDCKESVNPKIEGQHKRSNWIAVIRHEELIPRDYLIPDMKKLNELAKLHKGQFTISGVSFVDDFTIVTKQ